MVVVVVKVMVRMMLMVVVVCGGGGGDGIMMTVVVIVGAPVVDPKLTHPFPRQLSPTISTQAHELHKRHPRDYGLHVLKGLYDSCSSTGGKADHCTPSRIVYNHTLLGGKTAGVVKDLGEVPSVHHCVDKCCERKTCEVAFYLNQTCYAIECYAKELCQSVPVERNKNLKATIVYMNKRNNLRQEDKGRKWETRVIRLSDIRWEY